MPRPSVKDCLDVVCEVYELRELDMLSRRLAFAPYRQMVMWLARETTLATYPQIGRVLNRDHTTVMHGVLAHEKRMAADPDVAHASRMLRQSLEIGE